MPFTFRASTSRSNPRPMAPSGPGRFGARPYTDREMWGALAFLVVFALPFALAGTWMLTKVPAKWASGPHAEAVLLGCGALAFAVVGYGLLAGSLWARGKVKADSAAAFAHPDEPWKWRVDWAQGHALDTGTNDTWGAIIFALIWNLVGTPGGLFGFAKALEQGSPWAPIALLFPLAGVGLAAWAVHSGLRRRRYGVSRFDLATVPVPLGRTLAGTVRTRLTAFPPHGFRVTLSALRSTRDADNDVSTRVVWQDETTASGQLSSDGDAVRVVVPVAFRIPADAPSTDHSDAANELAWRLEVGAETPGVDYRATFDVPVYRTEESGRAETASEASHLSAVFSVPDASALAGAARPEPRSRVDARHDGDGLVLDFPPRRNGGAAWAMGAFAALWTAIIVFMFAVHVPVIFPLFFGLFDLLIVYIVALLTLEVVRVRANAAGVKVARGLVRLGAERFVPAADIDAVKLSIGMSSGTRVWHDLALTLKGGRTVPLGGGIASKREAEWLAAQVMDALGRAR